MREDFTISKQQFWIATIVGLCVIIIAICYGWMTWNDGEKGEQQGNQGTGFQSGEDLQIDGNPGSQGMNLNAAETNVKPAEQDSSGETGNKAVNEGTVLSPSDYMLPTEGEIARPYSLTELSYFPTLNQYMVHKGIDINVPEGTEVKAAAEGLVSKIIDDPVMGKTIWIGHAGAVVTVYSNLDNGVLVEEGDVVTRGTVIARTGRTSVCESSEEPHLHVEVLVNGSQVDPKDYFNFQ